MAVRRIITFISSLLEKAGQTVADYLLATLKATIILASTLAISGILYGIGVWWHANILVALGIIVATTAIILYSLFGIFLFIAVKFVYENSKIVEAMVRFVVLVLVTGVLLSFYALLTDAARSPRLFTATSTLLILTPIVAKNWPYSRYVKYMTIATASFAIIGLMPSRIMGQIEREFSRATAADEIIYAGAELECFDRNNGQSCWCNERPGGLCRLFDGPGWDPESGEPYREATREDIANIKNDWETKKIQAEMIRRQRTEEVRIARSVPTPAPEPEFQPTVLADNKSTE